MTLITSIMVSLLDERIAASVKHVDKLRLRIELHLKRVVTGDPNTGKSTFVNVLQ